MGIKRGKEMKSLELNYHLKIIYILFLFCLDTSKLTLQAGWKGQ